MRAVEVSGRKVRYAVVGVGWISQSSFLPGAAHTGNSEVVALVTGDAEKAEKVGEKYGIAASEVYGYDQFEALLASGKIDAVYIGTPNEEHTALAVKALNAGVHVLLEKPMATSVKDCESILSAKQNSGARLMVAYRLHHDLATQKAIQRVRDGEIGRIITFNSSSTQQVSGQSHRAKNGYWNGPVPDVGIYCINAVRNLFGAEPTEVFAQGVKTDERFNFEDTVTVTLKFPETRIGSFVVSYNGGQLSDYRVIGEKGDIFVQPAYGMNLATEHTITVGEKKTKESFPATDQFGGELKYFSDCILQEKEPEADGEEGLLDVRVLEAVEESLRTGRPVSLIAYSRKKRSTMQQVVELPKPKEPELVGAHKPSDG